MTMKQQNTEERDTTSTAEEAAADVAGFTIFRVNADRDEAVIVKQPAPDPAIWVPASYRNGVWYV